MATRPRRIGELAAATGLSVRALRHYDDIGLLTPSRSEAGQRLYTEADVRRLYRVVALRQLGVPLPEIAACLERDELDPRDVVRRQLAQIDRQVRLGEILRTRLAILLDALDRA